MTQLTLDDFNEETTVLVDKHYMQTKDWNIYKEITENHLTKENAISASALAEMFETNTRTIRDIIEKLRSKQYAKIIGDNNGYYVGTTKEFEEWFSARLKRTLTSIETTLNMNPEAKNIVYWFLNKYHRLGVSQGQAQLQFNGWEREFIRQFAEDYRKE